MPNDMTRIVRLLQLQTKVKQIKEQKLAGLLDKVAATKKDIREVAELSNENSLVMRVFPDMQTRCLTKLQDDVESHTDAVKRAMDEMHIETRRVDRIQSKVDRARSQIDRKAAETDSLERLGLFNKKPPL